MARSFVLDEFHVTMLAPRDTPEQKSDAVRQVLDSEEFQRGLRRAARRLLRRHGLGKEIKVRLSR